MEMQCTYCHKTADYSPLRLGKQCGQCHQGRWIPKKVEAMKDQTGKEMTREFAPNKRPKKEDRYKVRVIPKEPDYNVTEEEGRIKVTKREKDEE